MALSGLVERSAAPLFVLQTHLFAHCITTGCVYGVHTLHTTLVFAASPLPPPSHPTALCILSYLLAPIRFRSRLALDFEGETKTEA